MTIGMIRSRLSLAQFPEGFRRRVASSENTCFLLPHLLHPAAMNQGFRGPIRGEPATGYGI